MQEKYLANPQPPMPLLRRGQVFTFERTPENDSSPSGKRDARRRWGLSVRRGMDAISRYVCRAPGWIYHASLDKRRAHDDACCNDGTRPVIFKIERIDVPETPEEESWLASQDFANRADEAHTGWMR